MDGNSPLVATPPGAADVLRGFCQQDPPPEGYTLAGFDQRIEHMAERQARLVRVHDYRAVFHLTYLLFSQEVRKALASGRFTDASFAADMCCRFVDAYLQQFQRWERRDPTQCRAWQVAFGSAQAGRANVLQSMFLGMNAHIHYDLAFVTLGACRAAGDLDGLAGGRPSVSRSRVPDSHHRDFLVINEVGWESIPQMQEAVLGAFSRSLSWANRPLKRVTTILGQRLLMDARDTAWAHTNLLVHTSTEADRMAVAQGIDAHAASHTHLVAAMTPNPGGVVSGARGWAARHTDLPDGARDQLIRMAITQPTVSDLALRQLAFAGVDPAAVVDALVDAGEDHAVSTFTLMVHRHSSTARRRDLTRYWLSDGHRPKAALEAVLLAGAVPTEDLPAAAVEATQDRWEARMQEAWRCLAVPEVARRRDLVEAIHAQLQRLGDALSRTGRPPGPPPAGTPMPSTAQALAVLAVTPDPWVRCCAASLASPTRSGDDAVEQMIERVLFLRTTPVFMAVDATSLLPVAEALEIRTFPPGAAVIRHGDPPSGIHLITSGHVRVTHLRDGEAVEVARVGRGESLGELSALTDGPATADCTAITEVRTAFLPMAELARLLHRHPPVAIGMLRALSRRLTETTSRVARE